MSLLENCGNTFSSTIPFPNYTLPGDLVVFIILTFTLAILVIISTRCSKQKEMKQYIPPFIPEDQAIIDDSSMISNDDYCSVFQHSPSTMDIHRNPFGDGNYGDMDFIRRNNIFLQGCHSQNSQCSQAFQRVLHKTRKFRGWLIRKTRSGHVYGKYPL